GLESARETVPEAENSARVVVAAYKLLPKSWPTQDFQESLRDLPELPPAEQLDAACYARLCKELDAVGPAVTAARQLAHRPRGRHPLTLARNPLAMLLKDQQDTRAIAALLRYDALRLAQAGDLQGAIVSCRAGHNAARSIGDEPILISLLIRIACVAVSAQ